jgi:hypothetical protein
MTNQFLDQETKLNVTNSDDDYEILFRVKSPGSYIGWLSSTTSGAEYLCLIVWYKAVKWHFWNWKITMPLVEKLKFYLIKLRGHGKNTDISIHPNRFCGKASTDHDGKTN